MSRRWQGELGSALEPVWARRGDPVEIARLGRVSRVMLGEPSPPSALGALLAAILSTRPDGLACDELARQAGRRRSTVRAELERNACFYHRGSRRNSRWHFRCHEDGYGTDWNGTRVAGGTS